MKKTLLGIISFAFVFVLAACGSSSADGSQTVKIGVTGSDGDQWPILKEKAKEEGINIELVEFSDYTLPNQALANGEIDMNSFQHIAFLSQYAKEHGDTIVPIGSTVIAPIGAYSEKIDSLDELKEGDKVAIPDDPSNQARSLRALEAAGVIKLADDFGQFGDPSKIAENPKNIEIVPVVAQQTPRVLPDVAASFINNGVAGQAGLNPKEDPIYLENANDDSITPFVNVFAVRKEDENNEIYQKIAALYQDEEVKKAVENDTNGGSIVVDVPKEELQEHLKRLQEEE
ncbi:MetQ/NlpA family ABC transporter substrate-binding protein [Terribacillus sp. FSL K6-0262]|uniref:MetQ/NlpA family ABC transporter substrate-binding protein n=1 Tax=Terribacillus sp. FSL K6-0262 TaxID=2921447 RepID=UPI0030EC3D32